MIESRVNEKFRLFGMLAAAAWALHANLLSAGAVITTETSLPESGRQTPQTSAVVFLEAPVGSASVQQTPGIEAVSVARAADALGAPIDYLQTQAFHAASRQLSMLGKMPQLLPVSSGAVTSRFGARNHPLLGGTRMHNGVDLAAPAGTPIVAASDGTVATADWAGGYGLLVTLDHGQGLQTRYGHMSRLNVAPGQQVRSGQVIGYVGSTGLSTGPHVHYEVRFNGQPVDPMRSRGGR